jgi:gliding motility-associated-like protein
MILKTYLRILLTLIVLFSIAGRASGQIKINEYSCSNKNILDNYGATPDWIELYNAYATTKSLAGWHLSDKRTNPLKWSFPAGITIPAGGYLLVYASGKNVIVGGAIHTNFKLTQTFPDQLIFSDSLGAIVDSFNLKPAQVNHSRGRTLDGAPTWSVFTTPTPGASNSGSTAMQEYATLPIFATVPLSSGGSYNFFPSAITVQIVSPDPFVTLHYTTDGSTPTLASPLYTTPISITVTTVLRARSFSSNVLIPPSFVKSNTYFIGATHYVPVVSIYGDSIMTLMNGTQFSPETGLQYFDKAKHLKAETDGSSNKHGNDSWAYSQRGIDFISDDELGYNYAVNTKLFVNKSRSSFTRIIIKAAANDNYPAGVGGLTPPAHIRDSYCQTLSQRGNLHLDERTWSPAVLYVNGQYWGVYDIREKVDDNDFTGYYYNQGNTDSLEMLQTWGGTWSAYGGATAQNDWNTIKTYITSNSMAVPANYAHVDSILNIKSFVDYFLINSWAVTTDWLNWNTMWWRGMKVDGNEHKWRYCLWDNDATFGHYINYTGVPSQQSDAAPCNPQTLAAADPGGQGHAVILDSLMKSPVFTNYYLSRYADLLNTAFSCDFAVALLDSMTTGNGSTPGVIDPEMPLQCAKWGGSQSEWRLNVDTMRQFIQRRCYQLAQGLDTCYGLTGPYGITVDVKPAGAGNVKVNTISLDHYPWSGNYYGGINTSFKGIANPNYIFDHWEFKNHTPSPSIMSDSVAVNFHTSDEILAVFRESDEPLGGINPGVPQAFSPNGDGNNDMLFVMGSVFDMNFQVFNRWGQLVFESKDRGIGWDGTFDGKPCNPGVFAWRLTGTMANGDIVDTKGNVTLVR